MPKQKNCRLTPDLVQKYAGFLREQERTAATAEKYLHSARSFAAWLDGRPVTKETAAQWKDFLMERLSPVTVNTKLSAVNGLFRYNGPLVKTTCRKKCVNQDLAILILSRPEPPLNRLDDRRASRREAGSLDRAAMACYNGRPRGCAHNHVLTSPHPRRHRLNRPAAFCQGRRKAARNKPDRCPPASHNPALRGAAGCCSR